MVWITAVMLFSSPALATTYYVDATNGNDSNPGTSQVQPWKTIAKVLPVFFESVIIFFKKAEKYWKKETIEELIVNRNFVLSGIIASKKK